MSRCSMCLKAAAAPQKSIDGQREGIPFSEKKIKAHHHAAAATFNRIEKRIFPFTSPFSLKYFPGKRRKKTLYRPRICIQIEKEGN